MFLFGFSLPTPYLPLLLGIAVHLYKDAFHCCFNFDLVLVVFSFALLHCLQLLITKTQLIYNTVVAMEHITNYD